MNVLLKGIKDLSKQLKEYFNWYDRYPAKPDNQVLHLAQLIKFPFPNFETKTTNNSDIMTKFFTFLADKPELMEVFADTSLTDQEKGMKALLMGKDHPEIIPMLLELGKFNDHSQ